jgi:hypothetical protein
MVLNGCAQPVFRAERSRGGAGMAGRETGRDSASCAQSKRGEGGKTVRLRSSWGVLGCAVGDRGLDSEQGVSTVVDGIVNDAAGVWDAGGGETARFGGFCGKLGGRNRLCECFDGSRSVCRCLGAGASGPERGRGQDLGVVD